MLMTFKLAIKPHHWLQMDLGSLNRGWRGYVKLYQSQIREGFASPYPLSIWGINDGQTHPIVCFCSVHCHNAMHAYYRGLSVLDHKLEIYSFIRVSYSTLFLRQGNNNSAVHGKDSTGCQASKTDWRTHIHNTFFSPILTSTLLSSNQPRNFVALWFYCTRWFPLGQESRGFTLF